MLALLLAAAACPPDQIISLDLKPWKAALLRDAPGSDEQHAEMAALRMKTVPQENDSEADCSGKPVVEGVDIFEANLTGNRDKVIQVRFRMCKGTAGEWQSLRVAALSPLGGNRFCLLDGEDLSVDRSVKNRSCENPGKLPMTLSFKEVTAKGRNVVETRDEQGSCGDPEEQMSNVMLALYEAQGFSLKKIFETVLLDSHPTSSGAQYVQRATVTYQGGFPKSVHVERCTGTAKPCESEDHAWENGRYLQLTRPQ
jgi:hypothetical protein